MTYTEIDKDTASVKMYANIGWWGVNARAFTDLLESLDQKYKTIIVRMHCYGGDVFEGNAIGNVIDSLNAYTIGRVEGVCMSMGTILLNKFKKREGCSNAIYMYHAPTGYTSGTVKDHEATAKTLKLIEKGFIKEYTSRSNQPADTVAGFFDGHDHFFDSEAMLEMGLIDEIIEPVVKDVKKIKLSDDLQVDPEQLYDKYAAYLDSEGEEEEPATNNRRKPVATRKKAPESSANEDVSKNDNYMKKLLIEAFSLKNLTADSSDTAVLEALKEVMSKKDNEIVSLNEKISKSAEQTAEQLIKASGKEVTEDQKKTLLGIAATSGMDALNMFLGMMPAAAGAPETKEEKTPQLHTMVTNGGQGSAAAQGRESWNYDKWMEEDPDGFEAMADDPKQWDKFAAIYMAKFKVMPEKK